MKFRATIEVTPPPDFAKALRGDSKAQRFFDGLSFSQQQRHVQSIEGAKTPETRQRRVDKAIGQLHDGRK